MVKGCLISLFWVACWIPIQILVFHLTSTRQLFRTATFLFMLTLPAYGACYLWTPPTLGWLPPSLAQSPSFLGFMSGLVLHLLLYLNYGACFYYIDRPLTLRILIAFLRAPGRRMTLSELKSAYGFDHEIQRRLAIMQEQGLVIERERRYFLTRKGEGFGRFFDLGKKVLKVDREKVR